MISVVLPTYNGSKYIRKSIESIINQSYSDWELIVIDDCSTDDTNAIVKEYACNDSRICLYRNENNLKLPMSLNVGFSKARGDLFTWTSDDNIFKENFFEVMKGYLDQNQEIDLVFSNMTLIDAAGEIIAERRPEPQSLDELKYKNIVGASFMYRRRIYNEVGEYNANKFLVEDYDYWLRISRRGKIAYIPESLYFYRQHAGSLTESRNAQMLTTKIDLLEEELMIDNNLTSEVRAEIYNELATAALGINDFTKMKYYVSQFKKYNEAKRKINSKVRVACLLGENNTRLIKKIIKAMHSKS